MPTKTRRCRHCKAPAVAATVVTAAMSALVANTAAPDQADAVELARETVTTVAGHRRELVFTQYAGEAELPDIMDLIDTTLSEPYSIFTYRYFINTWPTLCILCRSYPAVAADGKHGGNEPAGTLIGVIISKAEEHRCSKLKRGYLAMLVVSKAYRKLGLGTKLAVMSVEEMANLDCREAVLETEITNLGALRLYERLGFIRQKRLPKYYLNGNDAFRLKLRIPENVGDDAAEEEDAEDNNDDNAAGSSGAAEAKTPDTVE